jgi:hypothetical protein
MPFSLLPLSFCIPIFESVYVGVRDLMGIEELDDFQHTIYVTLNTRTARIEKVRWNIPRFVRLCEVS